MDYAEQELYGPNLNIEDFDDPAVAELARLDLGSVLIPMPEAGQLQVELTETGVPSAVWVVTPNGRFTIAAYAAPKTGGLWREVAGELAESLRNDSAQVSIKDGPWGREVVGTATGVVRFIGVDGYRWMIRCVINGAHETMEALEQRIARDIFPVAERLSARFVESHASDPAPSTSETPEADVAGLSLEEKEGKNIFELSVSFLELLGKRATDLVDVPEGMDMEGNALRKEVAVHENKVRMRLLDSLSCRFHHNIPY